MMNKFIFFTLCIISLSCINSANKDDENVPFQFAKLSKDVKDNFMKENDSLERPFVLTDDNGTPVMLYVAVYDNGVSGDIVVPFIDNEKTLK